MDECASRGGSRVGSAQVTPINANPDRLALGSFPEQGFHPEGLQLLDIDAPIFQRFIDAGPLALKEWRHRQFRQRLRLAFTQQGIGQVEERIGSSFKAVVDLLTNVLQSCIVHYGNVLSFFDWFAEHFTLSGSLWQATAAFCFP